MCRTIGSIVNKEMKSQLKYLEYWTEHNTAVYNTVTFIQALSLTLLIY